MESIKKQIWIKAVALMPRDNGYGNNTTRAWDIINAQMVCMNNDAIKADVIDWLDSNCSNGHFSRWTEFGDSLWNECINFIAAISKIRVTFNI